MPPPADPVLQMMQERKSIQMGAKTGQLSVFWVVSPVVVAIDTTLNAACRSDTAKLGYVECQYSSVAMPATLKPRTMRMVRHSGSSLYGCNDRRRKATKWRAKLSDAITIRPMSTISMGTELK